MILIAPVTQTNDCSKIDHVTVGERVAEARAEAGLTQAQLASAVGLARSMLSKVETGMRQVSAVELAAISRELGRRIDWFVEPGPPAVASYRAARTEPGTQMIDIELDRLVRDVELVAGLVPGLLSNLPESFEPPTSTASADRLADRARTLLGLTPDTPAWNLADRVATVGLLPFALHLGSGADAGTVLLARGGVSVVNGDLDVGRRRLALAHELGHYLCADEYSTDWRIGAAEAEALEARLDRFARALLLPEADLQRRWTEWMAAPEDDLRDAAVRAGTHYRVDMATLARRLTELGINADVDAVRRVRTKKHDIVEKNLLVHDELAPVALPQPYAQAVLRLYRSETISEARALDLLLGTFDADALPDLPPVPEGEIWEFVS